MTEDLIAMAKLAGYDLEKDQTCREVSTAEIFSTFYRLVDAQAVARTREECAAAIDKWAIEAPFVEEQCAGEEYAQVIRALGERT